MLAIAAENRLSETAFCVKEGDGEYSLRWFTPVAEIDLCGHATFGAAYTLFNFYEKDAQQLVFNAPLAGHRLVCTRVENRIEMVFPRIVAREHHNLDPIEEAVHAKPSCVLATDRNLIAVFDSEETVRSREAYQAFTDPSGMMHLTRGIAWPYQAKACSTFRGKSALNFRPYSTYGATRERPTPPVKA